MRGRVFLVEFADRSHPFQPGQIERAWPQLHLATDAALQISNEIPLVEEIAGAFQRPDALADLENRRDRRHRAKRRVWAIAVLASELQRQVSAERVTGDTDFADTIDSRELFDHMLRVCREA